ncbi:mannose-6-phosphate isomerase, class I [Corynebacterium sp. ES2730-CONJ]|uniref:mannose-6-phosphate isomerase, class I n=1 Tax=Corynebacterium sp. ES2730-CONJ TaxID=2973941 RepID=UPI00216B4EA1|nr:mannose-6-phosphate isomerase, class I [Corynebacterium sp. ES2730-CONJ]MCS4531399.1 mannose-6-phosphate isomerase, class I [Corynebacterium sp. ES2730-CONJ]
MLPLDPPTQAYPWGSRTLIAQLRGETEPSKHPEAELWYGAHPALPARVDGQKLDELIAEDPAAHLGVDIAEKFSGELPYLLKILAANEPLSLQAHPSAHQAREGFERENASGIDIRDPHRNYRDPQPKPELLVALTEFHAMAGFRPLKLTRELLQALACPELDRYLAILGDDDSTPEETGLRGLFTTWISIPAPARRTLIAAIVERARAFIRDMENHPVEENTWMVDAARNIVNLHEHYPGDVGVLGGLLLNYLVLQPGEAIFLDAGNLHAYCRGMGVEIMANSDNVLRGGLTSKHVDVPELVKVLRFESLAEPTLRDRDGHYEVNLDAFDLHRFDVVDTRTVSLSGPRIVLCTQGEITVGNGDAELDLTPTQAVWISAADPCEIKLTGSGQVFVARA